MSQKPEENLAPTECEVSSEGVQAEISFSPPKHSPHQRTAWRPRRQFPSIRHSIPESPSQPAVAGQAALPLPFVLAGVPACLREHRWGDTEFHAEA